MKQKMLIFILLSFTLLILQSNTEGIQTFAFPVFDGGGGDVDRCGSSNTDYELISLDGYEDCVLTTGESDWIKYNPPYSSDVMVYSEGNTGVKVYIYESTNLSTPIKVNNNAYETGEYYTDSPNFFTEFYAEGGKSYFIKIIGDTSSEHGDYTVRIDDCKCNGNPELYKNDANFLGILEDSVNILGNIIFYESTDYDYELDHAIAMWAELETIDFIEVTSTYNPTITLRIETNFVYYWDDDYYAAHYIPNQSGEGGTIELNPEAFERDGWFTELGNSQRIIKTIAHELGHSLGINMDQDNQYKIDNIPGWDQMIENEPLYLIMRQNNNQYPDSLYSLGPCDKAVYRKIWN